MKSILSFLLILNISNLAYAQSNDSAIEAEVNAVQGQPAVESHSPAPVPPASAASELPPSRKQEIEAETAAARKDNRKYRSAVEEETELQNQILKRQPVDEISEDRNVDRFPKTEPLFKKPEGPKQGGPVRVQHPRAADGLIRINKDGSYQYKTKIADKSQSGSFKLGSMTPPKITTDAESINYESMYGTSDLFAVDFDYEWQPFRKFGALGLKVGGGFATASAKGYFANQERADGRTRSEESYNLYVIPLSVFLEYRFEYFRRQWVVPYVIGGGTYYGLAEVRDDGQSPHFSGAPAIGGGGGLMFSISRLDSAGAFTLSEEYGIADMWFVIEARAMQGLSDDIDFTNQTISAGITVDF